MISLQSRMTLLATALGVLPYLLWSKIDKKKAFAIVIFLFLGLVLGYSLLISETLSVQKIRSLDSRLILLMNSIPMIQKNLFLGIGPDNFIFEYVGYYNNWKPDLLLEEAKLVRSPHNAFLELLVENGIFTFFLVGGLFVFIAKRILKSPKALFFWGFFCFPEPCTCWH